jgi:hypothetical protein
LNKSSNMVLVVKKFVLISQPISMDTRRTGHTYFTAHTSHYVLSADRSLSALATSILAKLAVLKLVTGSRGTRSATSLIQVVGLGWLCLASFLSQPILDLDSIGSMHARHLHEIRLPRANRAFSAAYIWYITNTYIIMSLLSPPSISIVCRKPKHRAKQ